jgi:hypothetical protein
MTSQYEEFSRNDTSWSAMLYKSANAKYEHKLTRLDVPTLSEMRAPGAATRVSMHSNVRWTTVRRATRADAGQKASTSTTAWAKACGAS